MSDEGRGTERSRLDEIAAESTYGAGANRATIAHSFEVFRRHVRPGPILEMGPAATSTIRAIRTPASEKRTTVSFYSL